MPLSFKIIRNIGLVALTTIIVISSFIAFTITTRIVDNLNNIMQIQRPKVELAEYVRNNFIDAMQVFHGFIRMDRNDIYPAVVLMNEIIAKSETLNNLFSEGEVSMLLSSAKRFRLAIATYAEEAQVDITGSRAIEMEKIALVTAMETEKATTELVNKARANIKAADAAMLAASRNGRNISIAGIVLGLIAGLLAGFFMAYGLNIPIHQLLLGTQEFSRGNLNYRVKVEARDEIGRLAEAFNHMADSLNKSIKKEKELKVTAEVMAESEKKKSLELSEEINERMVIEEELKQSIEDLKRTQSMLVHSEKMASLGRLASEVAHEVNNPLMIISGNAQLSLMAGPLSDEVKNNLTVITSECLKAKSIIQRLLKFSRPSKGETKEVDINKCIDAVVCITERQFQLVNVHIMREYRENLPLVAIDEQLMQEVFMNLINNAKDAMPGGGTITVSTSVEGNNLRIDFKDTGSGMPEDVKKQVFEPFFTTKEKGTGLGIPVCYGILKAHNGALKFESELNKGTTATVLLPLGIKP